MRKKTLISVISVAILLIFASISFGSEIGTVVQEDGYQSRARVNKDMVVWEDVDSISQRVVFLAGDKQKTLGKSGTQQKQANIYEDKIVFSDNRYLNWDLFIYNISSGKETPIVRNSADQTQPDIYENYVVWSDDRYDNWDIHLYDTLTKKEISISGADGDQIKPAIDGDYVVWQDNRNDNWDIYGYQISTGEELVISKAPNGQVDPKISGGYVVWADRRNGNGDIYLYDLNAKKEKQITKSDANQEAPAVYNNAIVWQDDRSYNWDVYGYNITTGEEFSLVKADKDQFAPDVYGNKVVFTDNANYNNDIKYTTLPFDNVVQEEEIKAEGLSVNLNGGQIPLEVPPIMKNDRVLVPLRGIADALGLNTQWYGTTQTIVITGGEKSISLGIGSQRVMVGDTAIEMSVTPILEKDHTYVPVRFVSEAFGAMVDWDNATQTVEIFK